LAGGGLILGGVAMHRCRPIAAHEQMFAATPFFFGIQQLSESLVWLGVSGAVPESVQLVAIYSFSFMAFVFWPIYIPCSMACYQRFGAIRFSVPLQWAGLAIGLYYLWCFTVFSDLRLVVSCGADDCGSLAYVFSLPYLDSAINYFYLAVVTLPFFFSTNARIRWLVGPGFLVSFGLATLISIPDAFPSVWCFFAALMSISIFFSLASKDTVRSGPAG
jgi:hypothetical protein